ncbi:MAG: InlB B-repeat-containing protein, partial [Bifidobacterium sp.]|nr:InlB B-repeat-containing protein [Bifidobacterium sp.]
VSDGEQASRPDKDPLRDGYAFDGWFTGNIAYDFNQPVTKDITLTAKWTKGASAWSINPASGPATGGTKATLAPPVTPGIRFSQISAGGSIGSDGNLYSWGHKDQLARSTASTPINQSSLVTPPAGIKFTQTDAGTSFTLAIGSDGNLYSWGDNTYGQLGRNTNGKPDN